MLILCILIRINLTFDLIFQKNLSQNKMKLFNNIYKNKTVIVTGHTGFKGSWLSLWLVTLGAKVIGISKNVPTKPSHFDVINLKKKLNI